MGIYFSVPLPGPFRYGKRIGGGRRKPSVMSAIGEEALFGAHPYKGGRGNLYILGAPYLVVIYFVAMATALVGHILAFPFRRDLDGFKKTARKVAYRYRHLGRMIASSFERR